MIYLLYGSDTYRSRQRLKEITEEIRKRYGTGLAFYKPEAQEGINGLKNILETDSLFGGKKLLVLENFSFIEDTARLAEYLSKFKDSKEEAIVLWDKEIKETTLKSLKSVATKTQELKPITGPQLKNWIAEEAKKRGLRLYPAHWEGLALLGSDTWTIAGELDKLMVHPEGDNLLRSKEDSAAQNKTIFDLSDSVFAGRKKYIQTLLQLFHQGEDEFNLFSYLVNSVRTALLVKTYAEKGQALPMDFKIHPYVVKKISSAVKNVPVEKLKKLLSGFFEEDWKIKTGLSSPRESLIKLSL